MEEKDLQESALAWLLNTSESQENHVQFGLFGKTYVGAFPLITEKISDTSLTNLPTSGTALDGVYWTQKPSDIQCDDLAYSLWDILETGNPLNGYSLGKKALLGTLQRTFKKIDQIPLNPSLILSIYLTLKHLKNRSVFKTT